MTVTEVRCVLYDFDGTLADSIELILESYRHTMRVHRGASLGDEVWLAGIGTPLRRQLAELAHDEAEADAMFDTYVEHSISHHDSLIERFPGVEESLHTLRAREIKLGIVSSKRRVGVLRGLRATGLLDFFDERHLVCADDVDVHKPEPFPVHAALEAVGADVSETVFVGDSPHDLLAGRRAGVRTGAALWGPFPRARLAQEQPDHWLSAPRDVLDLLGRG